MKMITCPYCFEVFEHDKVHFRSERVSKGMNPYIPSDYDDMDEFIQKYNGDDKAEILTKCDEWDFFKEGEDQKYADFWRKYGGVTTEEITAQRASYRRKVIDPSDLVHQRYLKKQLNSDEYLYKVEGFATSITLTSGEMCTQRVCPKCHNPLPSQYGKNEARFIAVIGVTGAGKTVYLSQLIYNFENYVVKTGLAALQTTDSPLRFLRNNIVNTRNPLPGATPPGNFLQPLFYDLSKLDENGHKKVYTLVIYDVAGENCDMEKSQSWFGPFIQNMHGIFLLIDPMQFDVIQGLAHGDDKEQLGRPMSVLHTIHNSITQGKEGKCDIPLAICISKSDMPEVQNVMEEDLVDALMDDVEPVGGNDTDKLVTKFNATQYNPIAGKLRTFMRTNERALENFVNVNYSCYNYFAFTSLGCGVEDNIPEGPIMPKRIEEPLLWLFYMFGFIGTTETVEGDTKCPICGKRGYRKELEGEDRIRVVKKGLFGKKKEEFDYYCENCDNYYNI